MDGIGARRKLKFGTDSLNLHRARIARFAEGRRAEVV